MTSYGAVPSVENQPVADIAWRKRLGDILENNRLHIGVLVLTILDTACVLLQIIYTFFHECQAPISFTAAKASEGWIAAFEMAEIISIGINMLFLLECSLCLVAFGPRYYLPGWDHWKLHIFDATVVIATFVLDIMLRGKEREVAGLLIMLRLWRIVKIIEGVVVGVSFSNQETTESLTEELAQVRSAYASLEKELQEERERNTQLQQQINKGSLQ